MSTLTPIEIQRRIDLLSTQIIGNHLDKVIGEIKDLATKFNITKDKKEKSPFRNVLTVATEPGSSLEVIKNYIRYQVGRSGSSKIWKDDNGAFAKALVEALDQLKGDTATIIKKIEETLLQIYEKDKSNKSNQESGETDQQAITDYFNASVRQKLEKELHLKLAQLYLGYLAREHTALLATNSQQKV